MAAPLPLVSRSGPAGISARFRLKGPGGSLPEAHRAALAPLPTTVSDTGVVRFGDSLLLLSHGSEVPLVADTSRQERIVDDSLKSSLRNEFDAFFLATAKVLHPCPRNIFSVARADRRDGFGDDLELHYGQLVRIIASSLLSDQILYVHLQDDLPMLLPRAHKRARWRVTAPLVRYDDDVALGARLPTGVVDGHVVHINDQIAFENVETGQFLMSSSELIQTSFGIECTVYMEGSPMAKDDSGLERLRKDATWSFVNETWCDAIHEAEVARTGGVRWKEDAGDDFEEAERSRIRSDPPEFNRPTEAEIRFMEAELMQLEQDPHVAAMRSRVYPMLRSGGIHGIRKMRRMCEARDVLHAGLVTVPAFQGLLASRLVRLTPSELGDLSEAFAGGKVDGDIDYNRFFRLLEGQMPDQRRETVCRAYRKLRSVSNGGLVTIQDLMDHWNPESHPEVESGALNRQESFEDFLSQWEAGNPDGHVSPEEFLRYYRDVSMTYGDSADFVRLLKLAWDL